MPGRGGSLSASEVRACSSGSAHGGCSPHLFCSQVYIGFAGLLEGSRVPRPADTGQSSLSAHLSFQGMPSCPRACVQRACPEWDQLKESPLRLSAPLPALRGLRAAAVLPLLPLLPVPVGSPCLVFPEITFPSDMQVEQEMASQLWYLQQDTLAKCLVFHPPV